MLSKHDTNKKGFRRNLFYGWWIVIVAFLAGVFGGATIWYGFTAFFDPLINEFGWSITAIALASSLRGMETGLIDTVIGFLVDRIGSRLIILTGSIVMFIGYLILSRVHSLPVFYLGSVIVFIGAEGFSNVLFFSTISRWFHKRLGLALGLAVSGVGVGGFAVPGIVALLDIVDFRTVFLIFGIASLFTGSITSFVIRNRPEDMGYKAYGSLADSVPTDKQGNIQLNVHDNLKLGKIFSNTTFLSVTYLSMVSVLSALMVTTHIMPYLENTGYSRSAAGVAAMIFPVASIAGRTGAGWLSDIIGRRHTFIFMMVGQIAGLVLFMFARFQYLLVPSLILYGICFGGIIVLRPAALRDCYGTTRIGTIIGLCIGISGLGAILGPLLGGWVFDTTGSYSIAWIVAGSLLVSSIPLLLTTNLQTPKESKSPLRNVSQ